MHRPVTSGAFAALLLLPLLAEASLAQYPAGAVAFRWSGVSATAGDFCHGFSCTPATAVALAGESVTLMVRSDAYGAPWVIGASLSSTSCVAVPGALNGLALDFPVVVLFSGILDLQSPILACPSAYAQVQATVPLGVPSGMTFVLQALVGIPNWAGANFAFTRPIAVTVY